MKFDWIGVYDYKRRLALLASGESGLFVCPPAWCHRLGSLCGKAARDLWGPFILVTRSVPQGLMVTRLAPIGKELATNHPMRLWRAAGETD